MRNASASPPRIENANVEPALWHCRCENLRARIAALEVPEIIHARHLRMLREIARDARRRCPPTARMRSASVSIDRMIIHEVFGSSCVPKLLRSARTGATMASGR